MSEGQAHLGKYYFDYNKQHVLKLFNHKTKRSPTISINKSKLIKRKDWEEESKEEEEETTWMEMSIVTIFRAILEASNSSNRIN